MNNKPNLTTSFEVAGQIVEAGTNVTVERGDVKYPAIISGRSEGYNGLTNVEYTDADHLPPGSKIGTVYAVAPQRVALVSACAEQNHKNAECDITL